MTRCVEICEATPQGREDWIALRALLWPDEADTVRGEVEHYFDDHTIAGIRHGVFFAEARGDSRASEIIGFAECSIRCEADCPSADTHTPPPGRRAHAHLEGWFVRPEWRRRGVGRRLVAAVMEWARRQGCARLTSDTIDRYAAVSIPAHCACGFRLEYTDPADASDRSNSSVAATCFVYDPAPSATRHGR